MDKTRRGSVVEAFVQEWGYLGVFLGIIATGLGFPMPEELPVVIGGGLAGGGQAEWWLMLLVCIVGVILGDSCLYIIGRRWGARLVEMPFVKKRLLPPDRLASITENFSQYGVKILLFARLTPGIRAPIFLTAGITKFPLARFLLADGIYAVPGVSILFALGYFFTERMVTIIKEKAEVVKSIVILVVVLGIAGYFLYRFLRKPMLDGSPGEVPSIMEPMSHTLESMTTMLQPHEAEAPASSATSGAQPPPT